LSDARYILLFGEKIMNSISRMGIAQSIELIFYTGEDKTLRNGSWKNLQQKLVLVVHNKKILINTNCELGIGKNYQFK